MSAARQFRSAVTATCEAPIAALYGAIHDDLTGLLIRGAWSVVAAERVAAGRPGPVLVADVDQFKSWNDQHGHAGGDKVLVAIAGALRAELRHVDLVGRFGGDELIVMLGDPRDGGRHDIASLADVGERLRRRVSDLPIGPTVSIGGALCPSGASDLDAVIAAADDALYRVKDAGRDGVCVVGTDGRQHVVGGARVSGGLRVPARRPGLSVEPAPELVGRVRS